MPQRARTLKVHKCTPKTTIANFGIRGRYVFIANILYIGIGESTLSLQNALTFDVFGDWDTIFGNNYTFSAKHHNFS